MDWLTGCVLFFLIWWVVLFAVLPIGVRPVTEPDAVSGWRGAPARPRLWRVAIVTTLISALIWGGSVTLIKSDWMSFRHGRLALPEK
jgi:predicted secreted protein